MMLKRILLELARDKQHPTGSCSHYYDFAAPLDTEGHLVAAKWREVRDLCRVRRFSDGRPDEIGRLVHKRGGDWAFDCNPASDADNDEAGFKFDRQPFFASEYVSITDRNGVERTSASHP
jgi:hypothetical protein